MLKIRQPIPRHYANLATPIRFQMSVIPRVGCIPLNFSFNMKILSNKVGAVSWSNL